MKSLKHKKILRPAKTFLPVLFILALVTLLIVNARNIRDEFLYITYRPNKQISSFVSADTMTAYAKRLLYINHPMLASKNEFVKYCPNDADATYVLGCYHEGDNGIWVLNVSDSELNGINQVTTAYEMLHAGYARLSASEKNVIDQQMQQFYNTHVISSEIKQQMSAYARTEPGAHYEELYSVLATEVPNLPASLENHYRQYFSDRMRITTMYTTYDSAFTSRENAVSNFDNELSALKNSVNTNETQLNSLLDKINQENTSLNAYQQASEYANFNALVPTYNNLVDQYNALVVIVKSEINNYNTIVSERNSLVLGEQQLFTAISTSPTPEQSK